MTTDQPMIPFVQYMRPHGIPSDVLAPTPDGYEAKVQEILDGGYLFTCEVLTTGEVVLYVGDGDGPDITTVISQNGPEIESALKRLIDNALETINER